MGKEVENIYFIAIMPPPKISEEITQLKVLIAERFHSKHALKSPPHITLHMPFKWKKSKWDILAASIQKINSELEPFQLHLNGFSFFEPRVVYVDVSESPKLLELQKQVVDTCRKNLKLTNANYKDRPFNPHMTIGFRDLKKPEFFAAKNYFQQREYSAFFEAAQVSLLKYDGKKWQVLVV